MRDRGQPDLERILVAMRSRAGSDANAGMPHFGHERDIKRRDVLATFGLMTCGGAIATFIAGCSDKPARSFVHSPDAFVDFTTKQDGDPPSALDTGQVVDFVQDAWKPGRKPRIEAGKLVHGPVPETGAFANYYQAQAGGDCRAFGATWTVDSNDGSSTSGVMCLAAWEHIYESGTGVAVPKTPGHIVIDTVTSEWQWWVSDGGGVKADHLKVVKAGLFTAPPSDGASRWEASVFLEADRGVAYLYLPGNDRKTGTRYVTLTDNEIGAGLAAQGLEPATLAAMSAGAAVVMVEHFAQRAPTTARYPRFASMWAKTTPASRLFNAPPG